MDNVVQTINMEDIIPIKVQTNKEEETKITEMAQLIKNFGILDPLLVRPKNGKYEIVLGIDRYQAAIIAGLNKIPAIIKEVNDEAFSQYLNLENSLLNSEKITQDFSNNNFEASLNQQIKQKNLQETSNFLNPKSEKNSDIVNLSELSQKEYERNEIMMNNEQLNTNMMNNNFNQPQQPQMNQQGQEPTFGGRFFPSLEDEPTNMNMGNFNQQPITPNAVSNGMENNNLIDLTDISSEKEPPIGISTDSLVKNTIAPEKFNQTIQNPQPEINIPIQNEPPVPNATDSIINLEQLQANNLNVTPASIASTDFQTESPIQDPTAINQFDMSQNIAPQAQFTANPNISSPSNIPQTNFSIPQEQPTVTNLPGMNITDSQSLETPQISNINSNFSATSPIPSTETMNQEESSKDIIPVITTIKNLVTNLEAFGYKINIAEEELATSTKLTIEVEK